MMMIENQTNHSKSHKCSTEAESQLRVDMNEVPIHAAAASPPPERIKKGKQFGLMSIIFAVPVWCL